MSSPSPRRLVGAISAAGLALTTVSATQGIADAKQDNQPANAQGPLMDL